MGRLVPAVLLCVMLAGCAAAVDYEALGRQMAGGGCGEAVETVLAREKAYGPNRRLLFLMDAAQVHLVCGRHEESNHYFHAAERLAEDLWTRSLTREAAAILTNEYALPYDGEDFERALINLFSALNYAMLGDLDEALVEIRRLEANLTLYNDKYKEKSVYKEDAFGRYLGGMLYEAAGQPDDAYIDYYKAYTAYDGPYRKHYGTPPPAQLVEDLQRLAWATGRQDELRMLGLPVNPRPSHRETASLGRLVLVHLNGPAPRKRDDSLVAPTPDGPVRIAFPRFEVTRPRCRQASLAADAGGVKHTAPAELAENINAIAVKDLADRGLRVAAKTLARTIVKQVAIHQAADAVDDPAAAEATRVLLNVINLVVEQADTRSWRSLPGEVRMGRVYLPPGTYRAWANLCGEHRDLGEVRLAAGETRFLLAYSPG